MERSVTVTWGDPLPLAEAGKLFAHGTSTCIVLNGDQR